MTYLAWKYSGLPSSDTNVVITVHVNWNLDSIQKTLGYKGQDMQGLLLTLFTISAGAKFEVHDSDTVQPADTDSALFFIWGRKPDDFDDPTNAVNAMFGHMYVPSGGGFADGMCKFFFNTAVREYKAGSRRKAYAYLALSAHYLEDVGFPPHNEKNFLDGGALAWQAMYHEKIEDNLIGDSTYWFKHFDATCDSFARAPLPVCDPVMAVHSLAWECTWYDQDFKDYSKKSDKENLNIICQKCFRAIVPRVTGLFLAFKNKIQ
jgi:hypothetical protein